MRRVRRAGATTLHGVQGGVALYPEVGLVFLQGSDVDQTHPGVYRLHGVSLKGVVQAWKQL